MIPQGLSAPLPGSGTGLPAVKAHRQVPLEIGALRLPGRQVLGDGQGLLIIPQGLLDLSQGLVQVSQPLIAHRQVPLEIGALRLPGCQVLLPGQTGRKDFQASL